MKNLLLVVCLFFAVAAEEPAKKTDVNSVLRDLAVAQRDFNNLLTQCQVQIAGMQESKRVTELTAEAVKACKDLGQELDAKSDTCVEKRAPPKQ